MKPEKLSTDIQNEEFPENAIVLLDGTKLDCFPKENATKIENDDLKLDTTGVYLRIKKSSKQASINNETPQTVTEKDVLKEFLKAKTGTLANVSSIAGYLTSRKGNKYVFCIITNDTQLTEADKKISGSRFQEKHSVWIFYGSTNSR